VRKTYESVQNDVPVLENAIMNARFFSLKHINFKTNYMKKSQFKNLQLHKKTISNFDTLAKMKGGGSFIVCRHTDNVCLGTLEDCEPSGRSHCITCL
jgi:polynucleotide 5'-kinase involved in rRNA processing